MDGSGDEQIELSETNQRPDIKREGEIGRSSPIGSNLQYLLQCNSITHQYTAGHRVHLYLRSTRREEEEIMLIF